jgi:hypothetical protein
MYISATAAVIYSFCRSTKWKMMVTTNNAGHIEIGQKSKFDFFPVFSCSMLSCDSVDIIFVL